MKCSSLSLVVLAVGCGVGFDPERAGARFPTQQEIAGAKPDYLCPVTADDFKVLGPGRLLLFSNDSPHSVVTNTWREPDGDHYAMWITDDAVFEYVVPSPPAQVGFEIVYQSVSGNKVKEVRGANGSRQPSGGEGMRVQCFARQSEIAKASPTGKRETLGVRGATSGKFDFGREAPPETSWMVSNCGDHTGEFAKKIAIVETSAGWTLRVEPMLVNREPSVHGLADVLSVVSNDKSPAPFAGGVFEYEIVGSGTFVYSVPRLAHGAETSIEFRRTPMPPSPRAPKQRNLRCIAKPFEEPTAPPPG